MFTTLRLFSQVVCPDAECERNPCLFSHDPATAPGSKAQHATSARAIGRDQASGSGGIPGSTGVAPPSSRPAPASESSSYQRSMTPKAPELVVNARTSRQNVADRKKALQRLFEEYCRSYEHVIHLDPDLPARSAIAQEQETAGATQKNNYNQAIHSALVRIRGRPHPETLNSPYIGTVKESLAKEAVFMEQQASRLTAERVQRYLLSEKDFELWGYMSSVPNGPGGTEPNAIGQTKICDRCRQSFVVSAAKDYHSLLNTSDQGECRHHWGRTAPERVDGQRVWLYTCCKEPRGSQGCSDALHVFKDGKDTFKRSGQEPVKGADEEPEAVQMHKRVGFVFSADVHAKQTSGGKVIDLSSPTATKRKREDFREIVALDCEMIYTTGGMALARLSVTDAEGNVILDEIVKQHNVILDLNTRFSGLRAEDMDKAERDIWGVRSTLCEQVGPDTIIVGHGLENDLKALRLVHRKVIDTATLFPHIKGPPFRRALRDVTTENLGVFIQTNIEQAGHDSAADARAALNLVKHLVKKDIGL